MSNKEILEGNKIIAHWMGYKPYDNGDKNFNPEDWYCGNGIVYAQYKDLNYHASIDWLHPVWVKWRDINHFQGGNDFQTWQDFKQDICYKIMYRSVEEGFNELVKAITWYQSIKK